MTGIHAFQRRDHFTCEECFCPEWRDGTLWCTKNDCRIRWDPKAFGCGHYMAASRRDLARREEMRRSEEVVE